MKSGQRIQFYVEGSDVLHDMVPMPVPGDEKTYDGSLFRAMPFGRKYYLSRAVTEIRIPVR